MQDNAKNWDGGSMSWVLLSFAVIFPMSASIQMAFARRERALKRMAIFRSTLTKLYGSHACWDWPLKGLKSGRADTSVDTLEHADSVLSELVDIGDDMYRYLTLPTSSRARHRMTASGVEDAAALNQIGRKIFSQIVLRVNRLALFTEILKREGLPANEGVCVLLAGLRPRGLGHCVCNTHPHIPFSFLLHRYSNSAVGAHLA
mmetsp:Transcript_25977/g.60310  ORF Transcript_25977/g.60310 Transcript_25977/m.60310 type:complete len:203 (-) Transcript_25977:1443-2051(-)